MPQLWQAGARGQGITIAEIDTGVDADLAVFSGRVLPGNDFGQLGGDGRTDRDKNPFGHGTSMASIMVGGPASSASRAWRRTPKLLPVAIPLAGTTDAASDDRLADAIRWAADHGAKIISMSLGGVRRPARNPTACPDDEQEAIYHALRKGAVVLASGGNRGDQDNAIEEPGVCLGVVSVGAVDRAGAVAPFSSRHDYLTTDRAGCGDRFDRSRRLAVLGDGHEPGHRAGLRGGRTGLVEVPAAHRIAAGRPAAGHPRPAADGARPGLRLRHDQPLPRDHDLGADRCA